MKRKNKYMKAAYWAAVCAFLLTGCAVDHSAEKETVMENEKEEPEKEKQRNRKRNQAVFPQSQIQKILPTA